MLYFVVCLFASIFGAICGIGGGVIIKPVLDATSVLSVESVSFLSGCTVLAMTTYSVLSDRLSKKSIIDSKICIPISLGAALGGVLGKWLFTALISGLPESDYVGIIQSICLLIITVATLVYTIKKDQVKTHKMQSIAGSAVVGIFLGLFSSFLGIGGGPINLVVLFFLYSMSAKEAAIYSLYTIFFSQLLSLVVSLIGHSTPETSPMILVVMIVGGVLGGVIGRKVNNVIAEKTVSKLFIIAMVIIIGINIYNIYNMSSTLIA